MQEFSRVFVTASLVFSFVGCGGSGTRSDLQVSTDPITITSDNSKQVSKSVVTIGDHLIRSTVMSSLFYGSETNRRVVRGVTDITRSVVDYYANKRYVMSGVSPTAIESADCSNGGKLLGDFLDNNGNTAFDLGDSLSLTLQDCVEGDVSINGSFSMVLTKLQTNEAEFVIQAYDLTIAAGVETLGLNGNFILASTADAVSGIATSLFRGTELSYQNGDEVMLFTQFNFAQSQGGTIPEQYALDYDYTYSSSDIGGQVKVVTEEPFIGQGDYAPDSGQATISGADCSSLVIEANTGQIKLVLGGQASCGSGITDELIYEGPWEQLVGETASTA